MLNSIKAFTLSVFRGVCYGVVLALAITMVYNYIYPGVSAYQRSNVGLPTFNVVENGVAGNGHPMVRIHNQYNSFICSGTIISNSYILTAAHCLLDEEKKISMETYNIHVLPVDGSSVIVIPAKAASINNLADYGLMVGNFSGYATYKIAFDEVTPINNSNNLVTCGFPWGANGVCYKITSQLKQYYFRSAASGRLFPGMSGGPVFDIDKKVVIGVNSAVVSDQILIAPLVGLFESLDVEVVIE